MRYGTVLTILAIAPAVLPACGDQSAASDEEASLTPVQLLGKRLFEDRNLSDPPGESCASCHDRQQAFTGTNGSPIAAVARGSRPDSLGSRNVPTIMYASFSPPFAFVSAVGDDGAPALTPTGGQFWDGRAADLIEQAKGPFLNPREMNNASGNAVVLKVRRAGYAALFRYVFGAAALDDPDGAYAHVAEAIAAFEETATFHPFASKFDDVLRGEAQLDAIEARGFALFTDPQKGNCIACHAGDTSSRNPADWLFTDFTYDNLGLPRNAAVPDDADPAFADLGLCAQEGLAARAPAGFDVGTLCGAFKVPTLRNIELTAPYGHNGVMAELRDVVHFYATRDTNPELWYPTDAAGAVHKFDDLPETYQPNVNTAEVPYDRHTGEDPRLSDDEIDAVVAFLKTLTDR
jgi:cytochrome c peroxidase